MGLYERAEKEAKKFCLKLDHYDLCGVLTKLLKGGHFEWKTVLFRIFIEYPELISEFDADLILGSPFVNYLEENYTIGSTYHERTVLYHLPEYDKVEKR